MTDATKVCKDCGGEFPLDAFYLTTYARKHGTNSRVPACKPCWSVRGKKYYKENRDHHRSVVKARTERIRAEDPQALYEERRAVQLRYSYGIEVEDWDRLYDEQLGRCAICYVTFGEAKPCVDHCHTTGKVRGLLCPPCNSALGLLKDDPERMRRAIDYLTADEAVLTDEAEVIH